MDAIEFYNPLRSDVLSEARADLEPVLEVAKQRMIRLIRTAHENEDRAERELLRLLKDGNVEKTIKILSSDTRRQWHFDSIKGSFLVAGSKKDSLAALAELPDAIREWNALRGKAIDLFFAHREALETEEREYQAAQARARAEGREPQSRESYREARRKRR